MWPQYVVLVLLGFQMGWGHWWDKWWFVAMWQAAVVAGLYYGGFWTRP
jgi:hypothetical protein